MHEEIFKRFRQVENTTTRQFGGSGLRLSITNAYVELLGGKIWIESEEGKGSVFYNTHRQ
jgi:signal transduction histidine kinase